MYWLSQSAAPRTAKSFEIIKSPVSITWRPSAPSARWENRSQIDSWLRDAVPMKSIETATSMILYFIEPAHPIVLRKGKPNSPTRLPEQHEGFCGKIEGS